ERVATRERVAHAARVGVLRARPFVDAAVERIVAPDLGRRAAFEPTIGVDDRLAVVGISHGLSRRLGLGAHGERQAQYRPRKSGSAHRDFLHWPQGIGRLPARPAPDDSRPYS